MNPDPIWLFGRHSIEFVLVQTSHPGNVGAAARAISVMGFDRLTLVQPRVAKPHLRAEARALASGANAILAGCRVVETLSEALEHAQMTVAVSAAGREFAQEPTPPEQIAQRIVSEIAVADIRPDQPAPVALVFGSERNGLTVEQALQCQAVCSIESNPQFGSLNLAQAVQVLAYVMRQQFLKQLPASPQASTPTINSKDLPATQGQLDRMFIHLESVLIEIGFMDPTQPKRLMPRLRHLFTRASLSVTEVDIVRGICTQIEKFRRK